ncbi:MAG: hydroxymethylpyrimidine/phosphomethylpyrimidine kinase [Planctomycetota bacterium]|nr:MAG: hydroxymethylpyrimidine/phosphomethylpyrimidine kinase [Planctomycetota bacterium]
MALTIAGSDPGGGAGIQADLKVFQRFEVFGTAVLTALTAQNTTGVQAVHLIPADFVTRQLDAVLGDIGAAATKSGMLGGAAQVLAVAGALERHRVACYVCDPVFVAKDGTRLLAPEAERVLRERLLPLASLLTPNALEAQALSGVEIRTYEEACEAARRISALGPRAVLIKGGHLELEEGTALDVLFVGGEAEPLRGPRLPTPHTHGTGCTLSAAITAGLARGLALRQAVLTAKRYLTLALASAFVPGSGRGRGCPDTRVQPPL